MGSRNMITEEELDSLQKMITFFLSKTKKYWDEHPEEVYCLYTELSLLCDNLK